MQVTWARGRDFTRGYLSLSFFALFILCFLLLQEVVDEGGLSCMLCAQSTKEERMHKKDPPFRFSGLSRAGPRGISRRAGPV